MMSEIFDVQLSWRAKKDLKKVPLHIAIKLQAWIEAVTHEELSNIKKIKGFHDEPLQGNRLGQRSIRLNKSYRTIYIIKNEKLIKFIEIIEVNKHDY